MTVKDETVLRVRKIVGECDRVNIYDSYMYDAGALVLLLRWLLGRSSVVLFLSCARRAATASLPHRLSDWTMERTSLPFRSWPP